MTSRSLPPWLPDWEGAEEIARAVNPVDLKSAVAELVDLVLSEDTVLLDSLSEMLEAAIISPLEILAQTYGESGEVTELVVASRLVRRSAMPYLEGAPERLKLLIESLPE